MNPINQFWDTRVVAVFGLLGGYAAHSVEDLHAELLALANSRQDYMYIAGVLARLVADKRVTVSEKKVQKAEDIFAKWFKADYPNPKWFMAPPYNPLEYELLIVDTEWFKESLHEYLELFKANGLYSPVGSQPSSYAKQRKMMFSLLDEGTHQIGYSEAGWGTDFKILETALTLAEEDILVINHLFVKKAPVSKMLVGEVNVSLQDINYVDNYIPVRAELKSDRTWLAELKVDGQNVLARIQGEDWVVLKRLRADSGLYNFMHYMQSHSNTNIGRAEIQLLDGCDTYMDMTELPRRCGFDSKLKKIFFDGTTRLSVKLNNPKSLNTSEKDDLVGILSSR